MKAKLILPVFLAFAATAALGHGDVRNAAVLARMDAMKAIGDATKVLGEMAKCPSCHGAALESQPDWQAPGPARPGPKP